MADETDDLPSLASLPAPSIPVIEAAEPVRPPRPRQRSRRSFAGRALPAVTLLATGVATGLAIDGHPSTPATIAVAALVLLCRLWVPRSR